MALFSIAWRLQQWGCAPQLTSVAYMVASRCVGRKRGSKVCRLTCHSTCGIVAQPGCLTAFPARTSRDRHRSSLLRLLLRADLVVYSSLLQHCQLLSACSAVSRSNSEQAAATIRCGVQTAGVACRQSSRSALEGAGCPGRALTTCVCETRPTFKMTPSAVALVTPVFCRFFGIAWCNQRPLSQVSTPNRG